MAIKTIRVFAEYTSDGYVPMPSQGNIDYGVTLGSTFPETEPSSYQTDDPNIDVAVTTMTDFYVWIRTHGSSWNPSYTRVVRVYPDSPSINSVVMNMIVAVGSGGTSINAGGGVTYYLNGGTSQGVLDGSTYYEMSKTPVEGAMVDFFKINTTGFENIAQFVTDAGDPSLLKIPPGAWPLGFYFSASDNSGNPKFYAQIYKYSQAGIFTLLGSSVSTPEVISNGVAIDYYTTTVTIPETTLLITDRIAIRIFVNTDGNRTVNFHTQDAHLATVGTTFANGLTAINGLTKQVQFINIGTAGSDAAIVSSDDTHTINLPTASSTKRGLLNSTDWSTFNAKQAALSGTGFVKIDGSTISYDNSTYQPLDGDLTAIGALAGTTGILKKTGANTWELDTTTYLSTGVAASTYQRLDKMVSNLLASDTEYPNSNAVLAALALKANAENPEFTGYMTVGGAYPKIYLTDSDNNPDYFIGNDDGYFRIYDQTNTVSRFYITSLGVSTFPGSVIVGSVAKSGGLSTEFLKADGTVDSNTYVTSGSLSNYLLSATAASTYQRLDKMVSNLLASDTEYPNSNAVLAKLSLKADAASPTFTGNMTISSASPKLYLTDTDNNPDYFIGNDDGYFRIYDQTAGASRFYITSLGVSTFPGDVIVGSIAKSGGTASQFLKADGSVDSNTYVSSTSLASYLLITDAVSTYQRKDKMVSNLLASDTEYPNSNAVLAKLALKADAANPTYTGNVTISGAEPKIYFTDTDQNPDYFIGVDAGYFRIYNQTAGQTKFVINSDGDTTITNSLTAGSIIKSGGTSSQFLKADGTVDSSAYITSSALSSYLPLSGGTMTGVIALKVSGGFGTYDSSFSVRGDATNPAIITFHRPGYFATNFGLDTDGVIKIGGWSNGGPWPVLHSNNYNAYALPLSGGTLSGTLNFSSSGGSVLIKHLVNEADSWIFQENAANWGLYYKNSPSGQHTFGGYTSIGAEIVGMSAANASGNGVLTSNFVGATSAYAQYMFSNYNGYIWSASTIYAATSMLVGGNTVLHAGNYSSYALPTAGGTLSGSVTFASSYGNGTGDWTNMTTPTYLVNPSSGYWRINYLSNSSTISGVYNYQTGKNIYWGEPTDTGSYIFRGRKIEVTSNSSEPIILNGSTNQYLYIQSGSGYESMTRYSNPVAGNWYTGIRVSADLGSTSSYHIYSSSYGSDVFVLNTNGSGKVVGNFITGGVLDFSGDNSIASVNDKLAIGVNSTSYAWIQSFGGRPLSINYLGNNVLIGTTADAGYKLDVNGTGRFSGKLSPTKTAKNTYGIEIKGGLYGSPRLQLYDLSVDANGFCGLGVDMSGGAFEFSNYFPRTGGNGRWSVGSWAGDFGTGQYVSGYNEKFYITESLANFSVTTRVNALFRTAGTTNDILWGGATASATFGSVIGDTSATPRRTAFFRSSTTTTDGASVWWGRVDVNGNNVPCGAIDSSDGSLGFWVNSGGTGGGTWYNIFNMSTSGITMGQGSLVGNVSGTLNGYNTIVAYNTNNVRGKILVADPDSGNISTQSPESYSGEVRLGAAWGRGGIYAQSTLTMSTSSSQMDFVFGNVVKASLSSSTGLIIGSFAGGNYNENLRLVDSSGNYSVIAFGATGTSGAGRFNFLKNPSDNFELRNGSSANIYYITQAGNMTYNYNFGIGADPACKLHVQSGTVSYGQFRILNTDSNGEASINIGRTNQGIDARWTIGQGTAGVGDTFGMYSNGANRFTLTTGGNAGFYGSVTAAAFYESSDFRLKTLIEHNPIIDGIDNLQAKLYEKDGKVELGYFAQDAEKIMPYAVTRNSDGYLNLSYREVHTAKIARLEQRVAELEKQLNVA